MSTPFRVSANSHSACPAASKRAVSPGMEQPGPSHVLRFESLFDPGRSYSFPCDARSQVSLNLLSERARHNYLFARACVGRDFAQPCVEHLEGALH